MNINVLKYSCAMECFSYFFIKEILTWIIKKFTLWFTKCTVLCKYHTKHDFLSNKKYFLHILYFEITVVESMVRHAKCSCVLIILCNVYKVEII